MRFFPVVAAVALCLLSGCASIISGANQSVSVNTPGCEAASCELTNSKGTWFVKSPGSVTVLGLMHDPAHAVELFVDADIWKMERWRCHPLVNSATLVLARSDVEKFLARTGHVPRVVALAARHAE